MSLNQLDQGLTRRTISMQGLDCKILLPLQQRAQTSNRREKEVKRWLAAQVLSNSCRRIMARSSYWSARVIWYRRRKTNRASCLERRLQRRRLSRRRTYCKLIWTNTCLSKPRVTQSPPPSITMKAVKLSSTRNLTACAPSTCFCSKCSPKAAI